MGQLTQEAETCKNSHVVVWTTCPDAETADRIASTLVQQRLAACASQIPGVKSTYVWQGKVHSEPEVLLMIKTHGACLVRLEAQIQALHPYELPEIISVPIQHGLPAYLNWIEACVDCSD